MILKIRRLNVCIDKEVYKCKEMLYFKRNDVNKQIATVSWQLYFFGWLLLVDIEAVKDKDRNEPEYEVNSSDEGSREDSTRLS